MVEMLRDSLAARATRVIGLFREWDEDGDGTVSRAEFRKAMRVLLPQWGVKDAKRDDIDKLFDMLDTDGGGSIEYKEIRSLAAEAEAHRAEGKTRHALRKGLGPANKKLHLDLDQDEETKVTDQLRDALIDNSVRVVDLFRVMDANGDGMVSRLEFRNALPLLGVKAQPEQMDDLFQQMDPDMDGAISLLEMSRALRKVPNVSLDPVLLPGGGGEIERGPQMRIPLRSRPAVVPHADVLAVESDLLREAVTYGAVRSTTLKVGPLKSQLRGADLGINSMLTPVVSPRRRQHLEPKQAVKRTNAIYSQDIERTVGGARAALERSSSMPAREPADVVDATASALRLEIAQHEEQEHELAWHAAHAAHLAAVRTHQEAMRGGGHSHSYAQSRIQAYAAPVGRTLHVPASSSKYGKPRPKPRKPLPPGKLPKGAPKPRWEEDARCDPLNRFFGRRGVSRTEVYDPEDPEANALLYEQQASLPPKPPSLRQA